MNQLEIVHKKSTSKNQKTEQVETVENKRQGHGRSIALTRTVFHISGKNVYYVESELQDNIFYYVMWNIEKEIEWCSCCDNSIRGKRCKHIFAIEYAIRGNSVKDTDKLPSYKKVGDKVQLDYQKEEYTF
jgi:predicted nucleic acid-binding Zn finger protein